MGNAGQPVDFYIKRLCLAGIFFSRRKAFFFIQGLLFFGTAVFSQCPGGNYFNEQITAISDSSVKKTSDRLKELLALQEQMKACKLEKDSAYMFLLQRAGILCFRQADYPGAISYTQKSILVARSCIADHSCNTETLVNNYYNLSSYYDSTRRLEEKYAAIDSCILYFLKTNSSLDMAALAIWALSDKTEYLFNKGEYSLCNKDAAVGEYLTRKYLHGRDSALYTVFFLNKQAHFLYYSKKNAITEKLLENKIAQFEQTEYRDQLYVFYSLLGFINSDKKNYAKALTCFQRAYQSSFKTKYRNGCAQNLVRIGMLHAKNFNQPDVGLQYCADALKYADGADSLFILKQIGVIYVIKGMYDKAQDLFQQAFNTVQRGMNETTMLRNSFRFPGFNQLQDLSDLITGKADAYVQQYYHTRDADHLTRALDIYKKGDLFLAKIKTEQQLQFSSNLVWRSTARNLYEHAIAACYAGNNIDAAFYFFEKSRAVLLNDQINEQKWMADADIAKQARIKKMIVGQERALAALPASSDEYLRMQNELSSREQELNTLIRTIRNKNPLFYQNYLDTVFLTVPQLRKQILEDAKTLVEIFSGDSAVYVLNIAPGDRQSLIKVDRYLYDSLSTSFISLIANYDRLNKNFTAFVKTAHQLNDLLFKDNTPVTGRIIVSPDGRNFPFEALVMGEHASEPDYFLNHYATSYTYSVKYLTNQFAVNTNRKNNVLGIAPVLYKNYPGMGKLAGSDKSLITISRYFSDATNFIKEKATKENFLQNFPNYNIIQLYTHAADSSDSRDPVIYFWDTKLYLSELLPEQKPVTQLVVLSACETANGELYEGEGIFSFNRGFAALGIPAAVSNLWSVDNVSTYHITELFYRYLAEGLPTDIALQKAKLEFMNDHNSTENRMPYFWAGPVLTGKVDIIKGSSGQPWKFLLPGILLLFGTVFFAKKIILNKKKLRRNSLE